MFRHAYRLFGILLESDLPLAGLRPLSGGMGRGTNRVIFRRRNFRLPIPTDGWDLFKGLDHWWDPHYRFILVRSPLVGIFLVNFVQRTIDWNPLGNGSLGLAQAFATGRVLGLLLPYLKPSLLLHASVAVLDGEAVAFLGPGGSGKSTLAASFLSHQCPLLSDDLAFIQSRGDRFFLQPGPAEIRLWPKALDGLRVEASGAASVYPETTKKRLLLGNGTSWRSAKRPAPLKALCVLSRRPKGKIRIEDLTGKEALFGLSRNIYNQLYRDPKILRQQFDMATQLVQRIPVKRLVYPMGFTHLPQVCRAVLRDLKFPLNGR